MASESEPAPVAQELRQLAPALSVGLLTADFLQLGQELRALESAGIRCLHFDVMDGVFCPPLTLGPPVIKGIRTGLLKDVHLMVQDPLAHVEACVAAGADLVTIHTEGTRHSHRALQVLGQLKNANHPAAGIVRGVALNPGTPVEAVIPLLGEVEMVWLLAVNPGWGGQKFIGSTAGRMEQLKGFIRASRRDVLLGVDGGVTRSNIGDVVRMGADLIVAGSAIFDGKDPGQNARDLMAEIKAVHLRGGPGGKPAAV